MSLEKSKAQSPTSLTDNFNPDDYAAPCSPEDGENLDKVEFEGKLKKIEFEEVKGKLKNKQEEYRKAYNVGRLLRDKLNGLPSKLAPKVSAEANVKKNERLIRNECDKCTREILGRMADI